jgi:hypothetical protein
VLGTHRQAFTFFLLYLPLSAFVAPHICRDSLHYSSLGFYFHFHLRQRDLLWPACSPVHYGALYMRILAELMFLPCLLKIPPKRRLPTTFKCIAFSTIELDGFVDYDRDHALFSFPGLTWRARHVMS